MQAWKDGNRKSGSMEHSKQSIGHSDSSLVVNSTWRHKESIKYVGRQGREGQIYTQRRSGEDES